MDSESASEADKSRICAGSAQIPDVLIGSAKEPQGSYSIITASPPLFFS